MNPYTPDQSRLEFHRRIAGTLSTLAYIALMFSLSLHTWPGWPERLSAWLVM